MSGFFKQAANLVFAGVSAATDYARGWGNRIRWHSLEEGQALAKAQNKPAMIIIYKSWCPSSQELKKRFAQRQPDLFPISQGFVMINLEDDEEPVDGLRPDGGYVPRVIFTDSKGKVIKDVYNKGREEQKHFYGDIDLIIDSMKTISGKWEDLSAKGKKNRRGTKY